MKNKIYWFEPYIFLAFGLFHLHRIWGLVNRTHYASFWRTFMQERGAVYYVVMLLLIIPCIAGICVFLGNYKSNYWWRYIYVLGGGYVIWDLISQLLRLSLVTCLLDTIFDIHNPYWNVIWGAFVLMGAAAFSLGIILEIQYKKQKANHLTTLGIGSSDYHTNIEKNVHK